jgi:preprotein translocase subunit SecD
LEKEFPNLRFTDDKPDSLELGITTEFRADVREKTLSQSIEVIRNRIDEFGVSEPQISSQGNDRVVVEASWY